MSLATFSDELKVFGIDESSFNLIASVAVTNGKAPGTFGRITWSGDAKWLSVTPVRDSNEPLLVYKFKGNELMPMKYVTLTSIKSASFFNWTNRKIAIGTEIGDIYVWDLKQRKIDVKVDVRERQSVDHICVNTEDAYLASASQNTNKIYIHSLKTNKVVNEYAIPQSEHSSSLSFCMCKKSYLAASSYESTVCVWDIVKSEIVFKVLNSHVGACTDISFSPINYTLLASVGLTKSLKLYDLRDKLFIWESKMNESLHSVEMSSKGDKVIVGSNGGSIITYDLRTNKILNEFKAHEGPVLSIRMQATKIPETYQEIEMNTPDVIEVQSKTLDLSVIDIFSPITRDSLIKQNSSLFDSKSASFLFTPKVVPRKSESIITYNDSFLSKMMSPKIENVLTSTPAQSFSNSSTKKNDCLNDVVKLGVLEEETIQLKENQSGVSDIETNENAGEENEEPLPDAPIKQYLSQLQDIHKELRKITEKVSVLEMEIQTMRLDNESKFQLLQQNHENVIEYLINGIKQEVYSGNCDGKLEHICQRLLLNNIRTILNEKSDKVLNEMDTCIQKVNSVYKVLSEFQKLI